MDTYELLAQIEAGCRKDPKIPTRSSYRAAGELLMLRLRQEIFNTGVTFKTECRMMWDDAGRFIQQQIEARMQVVVDRSTGIVNFMWPTYSGTLKEYVFQQVINNTPGVYNVRGIGDFESSSQGSLRTYLERHNRRP